MLKLKLLEFFWYIKHLMKLVFTDFQNVFQFSAGLLSRSVTRLFSGTYRIAKF